MSEVQPLNAFAPIDVTPLGIVIEVSEPQPLNAFEPIDVTLLGILIELIKLQPKNAYMSTFPPFITTYFNDLGTYVELTEYEFAPNM